MTSIDGYKCPHCGKSCREIGFGKSPFAVMEHVKKCKKARGGREW